MQIRRSSLIVAAGLVGGALLVASCGGAGQDTIDGGMVGSGGKTGSGGVSAGSGGIAAGSGGKTGSGGVAAGSGGSAGVPGSGGKTGSGGVTGSGGAGAGGNTGAGGGAIPLKNLPVPSAGCGKPATVTSGKKTITINGQQRTYIIDIPSGYDPNKPYRFFYCSHWIDSNAEAVQNQGFYFLKPLATAANEPAIFLAPQALPGNPNGTWDTQKSTDHVLFDNILAYVKENLCIDTTRVFATGFSFGGMMTYSLSLNHQKDIRAAVGIAPANYNIYLPARTHQPIAWMQTTGMSDGLCPWVNGTSTTQGSKYIAIEHATDNGCTVPATIPTWQQGNHLCYDFQGCNAAFPTKACTFGGGHTNIASDPGSSTNWIPQESWKFFTQF